MLWKEFLSFSESCEPSHLDAISSLIIAGETSQIMCLLDRVDAFAFLRHQFGGVRCRSILHLFINIAYYVKLLDLIDILGAKFRKSFSSFFFVCYFFKIFQVGLSQKLLTVSYVDRKSSTDFI